ncbi:MAG: hypothetical protein R6V04_03060 [bacterium]
MKDRTAKNSPMKNWYRDLEDRYADFPEQVQILHMVSDLKKAEHFWDKDKNTAVHHLYLSIILIDFIVNDPKWKGKLKEVLRLREVIGSLIASSQPMATPEETIKAALLLHPEAYATLYQSGRT